MVNASNALMNIGCIKGNACLFRIARFKRTRIAFSVRIAFGWIKVKDRA